MNRHEHGRRSKKSGLKSLLGLVVLMICCIVAGRWYERYDAQGKMDTLRTADSKEASEKLLLLQESVSTCRDEMDKAQKAQDATQDSLREIRSMHKNLTAKHEMLAHKYEDELEDLHSEHQQLTELVTQLTEKEKKLTKRIQDSSRQLLNALYGSPPYYVSIKIEMPNKGGEGEIIVKMADEFMPYTVSYWLAQVSAKFWDGCVFFRNANHVLQADPRGDTCVGANAGDNKELLALERSITFQEYSEEFPHVKGTLGLAGRPGGPDFYISLLDNTRSHGPGGQTAYAQRSEADPAFASVVQGYEWVEKMHALPAKTTGFEFLIDFVTITSARLVPAP